MFYPWELIGSFPSVNNKTKKKALTLERISTSFYLLLPFFSSRSRGEFMYCTNFFLFIILISPHSASSSHDAAQRNAMRSRALLRCQGRPALKHFSSLCPKTNSHDRSVDKWRNYPGRDRIWAIFFELGQPSRNSSMTNTHFHAHDGVSMTQVSRLLVWTAEILQNTNFHVETIREKYNFPSFNLRDFQCWL